MIRCFQLPDVDFRNRSDKKTFDIHCTEASSGNFPYTFVAHEDDVKADWLREIQEHSEEDRKSQVKLFLYEGDLEE